MKVLKWVLLAVAVIIVLVLIYLYYMGMFSTVKTAEMKMGPYLIAYEEYVGPYMDTGKVFDKVYKAVKAEGIETTRGLGIYLDDPAKVPADELRSQCGVIIEKDDMAKFNRVRYKFKTKYIPQRMCIVGEFPIRNSFSYAIGPMKGYPALGKHVEEKGYKMSEPYELYDMEKGVIYFVMPILK